MSIDDTADLSRRVQYTATEGQTVFDYAFRIFDETDLVVYVGASLKTLNSHYTVTGVDDSTGGTVVFLAGLASGEEVTIYSDTLIERSTDFQQNGPWASARLDEELDRSFVIDQEQRANLSRSLRGSILEDVVSELPSAASRAGKYLFFNASGQPTAVVGDASDPLSVQRQTGTTTTGQTAITTDYAYTLGANHLALYLDGLRKVPDIHYTETDSNTITLLTPASAEQRYEIIVGEVSTISLNEPVKLRHDQTMSGGNQTVTITSWTYTPDTNQIEVWGDGALLRGGGVDYTETSSNTIELTAVPSEGYAVAVLANVAYSGIGASETRFAISAQEVAAGVIPTNYNYPWGHILRYGAANNGTTADTAAFTAMLAAHPGSAYVPYTGVDWITGKLTLPANTRLTLEPGVVIHDSGALLVSESLFTAPSVSRVEIIGYGAAVSGYAYGTTGTARHLINISGGAYMRLCGLTLQSSDMDGLHLTGGVQNVTLEDINAIGNGRDGIRIAYALNVKILGPFCSNNDGVGLHIIPAAATDSVSPLRVINPRCGANGAAGVRVDLEQANSATAVVDIAIVNPFTTTNGTDDTSSGIELRRAKTANTVRGVVRVTAATMVTETCAGLSVRDWATTGPKVIIDHPVVINPNQTDGTNNDYHGGIILHATAAGGYVTTPGNVHLIDPVVIDNDNNLGPAGVSPFSIVMDGSGEWVNVVIDNPESNATSATFIETEAAAGLQITYKQPKRLSMGGAGLTATPGHMGMVIHNDGEGATRTITLPSVVTTNVGTTIAVEVMEAQYLELDPNGSQAIRPGSGGAGYKWRSNTVGSCCKIRAAEAGYWHIVEQTGTWASVA